MIRHALTACAAALACATPAAAQTVTTEVTPGTGQRSLSISTFDPLGQSFTAVGDLVSFGFQFQTLNQGSANAPITLSILDGAGLGGTVLASRTLTAAGIPTTRTPTFVDFAFGGLSLSAGAQYTAVVTSSSNRYGLVYGPNINIFTGALLGPDAYAGGRFVVTGFNDAPCSTGMCDANFRFTSAIAAAIPEPATWAMLILGIGATGTALRRRRNQGAAFA